MNRKLGLEKVSEMILKDRNNLYGDPEDNFANISSLWRAYLGRRPCSSLTSVDVAVLNILTKVARLENTPNHIDSFLDIAGYALCGLDCIDSHKGTNRDAIKDLLNAAGNRQELDIPHSPID